MIGKTSRTLTGGGTIFKPEEGITGSLANLQGDLTKGNTTGITTWDSKNIHFFRFFFSMIFIYFVFFFNFFSVIIREEEVEISGGRGVEALRRKSVGRTSVGLVVRGTVQGGREGVRRR